MPTSVPTRRRVRDDDPAEESSVSRYRSRASEPDDEPEEAPRARRRRDEDDEPEEERRPRRDRSRDDAEDDDRPSRRRRDPEDEPPDDEPRSRRRGRDDEPEEDRPRSRRSRDEEEDDRPARRSRREEPEDEPRSRRRGRDEDDEPPRRQARAGFDSYRQVREETTSFDDFKFTEEEQLVKFLDEDGEPFDTFAEHFCRELPQGVQKAYVCIKDTGERCPLCDIGDKPRAMALWNVVVIEPEDTKKKIPQKEAVKVLRAGPAITKLLQAENGLRTGHLDRHYYTCYKTESEKRSDGPPSFFAKLVRERDLFEEWGVEPLTDRQLDELEKEMEGDGYITYPKRGDIRHAAELLAK